jgi:hypothetical protein
MSPTRRILLATALAILAALATATVAWAAAPIVTYTTTGAAGTNGWFRGPVTVEWTVDWNGSTPVATTGCEPAVRIAQDTTGTTLTCRAQGSGGTTTTQTSAIRIDATPPAVTAATASRPPDSGPWYRAPVAVAWSGTDATSGIAACTTLTYAGPDGPAAPTGTCTDVAGNTSAPLAFSLAFDATPPALTDVSAVGGDTVATVRWQAGADATAVTVTRSPGVSGEPASVVYQGTASQFEDTDLRNGRSYDYTVTATDAAGNPATASTAAVPASRLRAPSAGARVSAAPVLRWRSVPNARYYNVQLFRGTTKVLSAWPAHAHLRLRGTWRYAGIRRRLVPGVYRWFVWPGFGRRAQHRYGSLIGTRRFVVIGAAAR